MGAGGMVKGLVMSVSGLPDRDRRKIVWALGVTYGDGIACFGEVWLRKWGESGRGEESEVGL